MPLRTQTRSKQIRDGSVRKEDMDITTVGQSVVTVISAGDRISITETGADVGTGVVTVSAERTKQFTQLSGRFPISSEWESWSDPDFGPAMESWDIPLGTGSEPTVDWDGLGVVFPAGATLNRMIAKVRANNNSGVATVQTFVRMHDVDLNSIVAIDSIAEVGAVTLSGATVHDLSVGLVAPTDLQMIEISLGDYTVTNDGADLHFFMRTSGTASNNRNLKTTVFIEWQQPESA